MGVTNFPGGITSFGVPLIGSGYSVPATTGTYWFVDSTTGSNGNSGRDKDHPYADLATAVSSSTASKGDVILLMPGHSETVTTTITPKAGSYIIGLGHGRNRAVLTAGTGAIDTFTISAANVTLQNFVIVGAASGVTALVECSSNDLRLSGMELQGAAAPTTLITFSNASATRPLIENCIIRAAAGTAIIIAPEVTGTCCEDMRIINTYIHGSSVRDIDTAVIQSSKKNCTGLLINGLYVVGIVGGDNVAGAFDFNSSTGLVDGMLVNVHIGFDAAVTGGEVLDAGGMLTSQCFFTDVVSATGARFPATTAS
jgi:hypothetical protein